MRSLPGIGSHHSARRITDEWLTPPAIVEALGPFDLDPCAPVDRPWDTAARHFTVEDDGLEQSWSGRVWLNPPYSTLTPWMERMAAHGDGIALVFARCETSCWFEHVWPHADAFLFVAGRITFRLGDGRGSKPGHSSGGPSVLIAYGERNAEAIASSGIRGALLQSARLT